MANLKSSKKDLRRIARRTKERKPFARNARVLPKKVLKFLTAGDIQSAVQLVPQAFKAVDKAAKKNIIHQNKAARIKSRIAKALNKKSS